MKRLLYLFLSSAVFLACNQSSNNAEIATAQQERVVLDTQLKLNNGAKWKVDSSGSSFLKWLCFTI